MATLCHSCDASWPTGGRTLVVTLSEDKSACDLQEAFKGMFGPKVLCVTHRLKLYMTKTTENESWFCISPEDVDDMAKGKIPETIRAFMASKYAIPEGAHLSRSPLAKVERPWNEAPLLVQVPEIEWHYQPEPNPVYALDMDELYFVDLDQAVEQLQSIHEEMYRASKEFDSCRSFPVVDHAYGMEKTTFARHYIRLCRKIWPIEATRIDFQQTICAAHTIMWWLESGVFFHEVSAQVTMNDLLAEAVRRPRSPEMEMSVLKPPLLTSPQTFAEDLVAAIGPLFIVLDNIGRTFGDGKLNEKTSRDLFAHFCADVLLSWTQVPGLFFIVLGHGPFLRFFKSMKSSLNAKQLYLERLPLF